MAETTQISATIGYDLEKWIDKQPERKIISFSKMVEILLTEAQYWRGNPRSKKLPADLKLK